MTYHQVACYDLVRRRICESASSEGLLILVRILWHPIRDIVRRFVLGNLFLLLVIIGVNLAWVEEAMVLSQTYGRRHYRNG